MGTRVTIVMSVVALVLTAGGVFAQSDEVQRTVYGDPDIQGLFTFRTLTPLQRPVIDQGASSLLAGRQKLTEEEAAEYEAERRREMNRDTQNLEVRAPGVRYQSRAEGGVGGYNEFWYERGIELVKDHRTALIVDPPEGRIPFTQSYLDWAASWTLNLRSGFADSYTDRSLGDRCLMGFNAGPPMVSSAYNNNVQILQTTDHVVIYNEMVHNARIIPIGTDARHGLRQYSGESQARWEGDTLVIETRGFLRETSLGGSSRDTYVVERLTRLDPETVAYEFTVEDPNNFTQPWTAMMPLRQTEGPLFEYACHEGNIGMVGIMAGARNLDTQKVP